MFWGLLPQNQEFSVWIFPPVHFAGDEVGESFMETYLVQGRVGVVETGCGSSHKCCIKVRIVGISRLLHLG